MTAAPNMCDLRTAIAALDGEVVALGGRRGARVHRLVDLLAFGGNVEDDQIRAALAGGGERRSRGPAMLPAKGGKQIALVTMFGVALPKLEMQPFCYSTALLASTLNTLAGDPTVAAILIEADSPGGVVTFVPEAATAVYNAAQVKPVVAYISPLAASACYWILAGASEIIIAPSGDAGSIGCYLLHVEASRMLDAAGITPSLIHNEQSPYKTEGNPFEPLTAEARQFEQQQVNKIGRQFINAVARGRGIPASRVEADFGGGRVLMAADMLRVGGVDRIGDIDLAIRLASSPSARRAARLAGLRQESSGVTGDAQSRQRRLALLRS